MARRTSVGPCLTKGLDPKCWIWRGGKTGGHGYGCIAVAPRGTSRLTHIVAYEALVGPIPDGMKVIHLCSTRTCWNPNHLKLGTYADVVAYHQVGKRSGMRRAARTHCARGHEYTPENCGRGEDGARFCCTCNRDNNKRWQREWTSKLPNPPRTAESRAAEAATCRQLREQGMNITDIAAVVGLSRTTVSERLKANAPG